MGASGTNSIFDVHTVIPADFDGDYFGTIRPLTETAKTHVAPLLTKLGAAAESSSSSPPAKPAWCHRFIYHCLPRVTARNPRTPRTGRSAHVYVAQVGRSESAGSRHGSNGYSLGEVRPVTWRDHRDLANLRPRTSGQRPLGLWPGVSSITSAQPDRGGCGEVHHFCRDVREDEHPAVTDNPVAAFTWQTPRPACLGSVWRERFPRQPARWGGRCGGSAAGPGAGSSLARAGAD